MSNKKFYLTFGQKYRYEPHPSGNSVSPDGYVLILAPNEGTARDLAFNIYGSAWAFIYSDDAFEKSYHPLGMIRSHTVVSTK